MKKYEEQTENGVWRVVKGLGCVFQGLWWGLQRDGLTDKQRSAQGAQSSVTGRYTVRHRRKFGWISEKPHTRSDLWMTELG